MRPTPGLASTDPVVANEVIARPSSFKRWQALQEELDAEQRHYSQRAAAPTPPLGADRPPAEHWCAGDHFLFEPRAEAGSRPRSAA